MRLYGIDYFDKLQMAGFKVVRDNPFDNKWLSEQELEKHCLDRIENVIVTHKDQFKADMRWLDYSIAEKCRFEIFRYHV